MTVTDDRNADPGIPASPAGLTAGAARALEGPGATVVSSLLMQDAVAADVISVASGHNKVALFSNPFLAGKEEALVIDTEGHLTYLQRADTATGWQQAKVHPAGDPHPYLALEVVVVVVPGDLSVWAIFIDGDPNQNKPRLLKLTADVKPGGTTCGWQPMGSVSWRSGDRLDKPALMYVYYDGRSPHIAGVDTANGRIWSIFPSLAGSQPFSGQTSTVSASGKADEVCGGSLYPHVRPVVYVRTGTKVTRYDTVSGQSREITAMATRLVGAYSPPSTGNLGCIFLSTDGELITWQTHPGLPGGYATTRTPGLGYLTATAWQDVNQMAHIYGVDNAGALKVLHQASWDQNTCPVWSQSKTKQGGTTPTCVGLLPSVAAFAVDPFPDYVPTELVKISGTAVPSEQFSFCTQDITTTRWSREKLRLPADGSPHLVTHYVSEVAVLNRQGAAMPQLPVSVSAEALTEIQVDGAAYLVGPGHDAALSTGPIGRITIAVAADSLVPPTLHVDAAGLQQGAVIQPAAAVHDYLAGTGTLPSQNGKFDETALSQARVDGKPVVKDPNDHQAIEAVVTSTGQAFDLAAGKSPTSRRYRGSGPAPAIHGFAVGPDPRVLAGAAMRPGTGVGYHEFATAEEADAYLDAMRACDNYGGIWEDFLAWAGDVWEGIKNGVVAVANVVVTDVVRIIIEIGGKIVELAQFIIDGIETAVHAVEAIFRQVVEAIGKVIDWLKALFAFKDIWETKIALQVGIDSVTSYLQSSLTHFASLGDTWFKDQKKKVHDQFNELRTQVGETRLGDFSNRVPAVPAPSGGTLSQADLSTPQGNWMMNQVTSQAKAGRASPSLVLDADSPVIPAWDNLWNFFEGSGVIEALSGLFEETGRAIVALFDLNDQDTAGRVSAVRLLNALEKLIDKLLDAIDTIFKKFLEFAGVVVDNLSGQHGLLTTKIEGFGFVNTLYRWIQVQAGVPDPKDPTVSDLTCLIAAFVVTTAYKLVKGVDNPPFPGGKFPKLPAPPWDPSYAAADPDPQQNHDIVCCQVAFGFLAMIPQSALFFMTDWNWDNKWGINKEWDWFIVIPNSILGLIDAFVLSCPPMGGKAWASPATGAWVTNCLYSLGDCVTSILGPLTPLNKHVALKNVLSAKGGTIIASIAGAIQGGCTIAYDALNPTTDALWASDVIGIFALFPGQLLRFAMTFIPDTGTREFVGLVIAVLDGLCMATSNGIIAIGAAVELAHPPKIDASQTLPAATKGSAYPPYQVKATGGDLPMQGGLGGWSAPGLPKDLKIDTNTGIISGQVTDPAGTYKFQPRVWDKFSPPLASAPVDLTIVVNG